MKNKNLIYEEEYKKINGIEQYLLHSGTSYDNPVMLFLHCSGFPESLLAYKFQKKWENIFTIVNLDQRGTGKTFTRNPNEVPTIEILLEDIHETVAYLKEKYKKDKIVICGHSLGTLLGSLYISRYSEDVLYYIGIGQVVNFKDGENKAYEKLKELAVENNDKKVLMELERIGDDFPGDRNTIQYVRDGEKFKKFEQKYGLVENPMTFSMFKNIFMSPIFKWSDVSALNKSGKVNEVILDETIKCNIRLQSREYKVPFYCIMGEDDWQTPYNIAKEYFDEIQAPQKKFYTVRNGKHLTVFNEYDLFYDILVDIQKNQE